MPGVREALVAQQRKLGHDGVVMAGRDIGTVVFPDADAKFFLTAAPEVRAQRRYAELQAKGGKETLAEVLADQTKRDRDDSARAVAPLRPADDAIIFDSSRMDLEAVVEALARAVAARLSAGAPES
jgi:cytidylate kinase